jgi:hypothetical protein
MTNDPGRFTVGRMEPRFPRQLMISMDLSYALMSAAVKTAAAAAKGVQRLTRPRRGEVLKVGPETPLWNELSSEVKAQLTRRGEKAKLARILGIPRQRLYQLLNTNKGMPDAERTLLLLAWLHARNSGHDLA